MTASTAQIANVRRMVAEPTTTTYSDATIQGFIESYPLLDVNGREQYLTQALGTTIAAVANSLWVPTYDLNAAAADIWDEKAAALAADYDFTADGASYSRSQAYQQACQRANHYRSRRRPTAIELQLWPREPSTLTSEVIGNLREPD